MKKLFPVMMVGLVSALAGCCVHSAVRHPGDRVSFVDELKSDTVALVIRDDDDDVVPLCGGVWIDVDQVVTAEHCTRAVVEMSGLVPEVDDDATEEDAEAREAKVTAMQVGIDVNYIVNDQVTGVYREPKKIQTLTVTKVDHEHDLALLKVKNPKETPAHHVAPLASKTPEVGDSLHVMGHVTGMYYTYFPATCAAYREEKFLPFRRSGVLGPWLQVSGPVYKGNSGGGAYNENGELVGIASRLIPAPNASMFVHLETIRSFLGRPVPR